MQSPAKMFSLNQEAFLTHPPQWETTSFSSNSNNIYSSYSIAIAVTKNADIGQTARV
jgi:hypothetical protein